MKVRRRMEHYCIVILPRKGESLLMELLTRLEINPILLGFAQFYYVTYSSVVVKADITVLSISISKPI